MNWITVIFITGIATGLADRFGYDSYGVSAATLQFSYFDTELVEVVSYRKPDTNLVLAPASAKAVLALLLHGATGVTSSALQSVLNLPSNRTEAEVQLLKMHHTLKGANSKLLLKYSNAIFISNELKPKEMFRTITETYNAPIMPVNFANPKETATRINDWVKRHTANLINEIITPETIHKDARLVLVNAMYFKGKWLQQFQKPATRIEQFYVNPKKTISAYMMNTKGYFKYSYVNSLHASVIQLPYQDPKFNLVILLPAHKDRINQLIKDVNHNRILEILDDQDPQEVKLSIPRFNIEFTTELSDPLTHMMKTNNLFSDSAELPNIAWNSKGLKVDTIVHKASIEVNEEGTTASAVTGAQIIPLMTPITEEFIANHPFMFIIYNNEDKMILFEGVLHEPTDASGNYTMPAQSNSPLNTRITETVNNFQTVSTLPDRTGLNNQNSWQQPGNTQHFTNQPLNIPPQQQQLAGQWASNQQQTARPVQEFDNSRPTTNFYQQTATVASTVNSAALWPHTPPYVPVSQITNNINSNNDNNGNRKEGFQRTNATDTNAIRFRV